MSATPNLRIPPSAMLVLYQALPIVVLSYGFWDQYADYLQSQRYMAEPETFDFIIIGAGSAGSVLANRLSANSDNTVLLLEAGGNPNPMLAVPGYFGILVQPDAPQINYEFYTVPQKDSCKALNGQKSYWPRGKGLGGCSNLNAMFYQRGNPHDFDRWAELSGSDQWKFSNVLRNFKNVEDYHGAYYDERWHGRNRNGGVHVSTSPLDRLTKDFLHAGEELGYSVKDVNGYQESAFSRLDVTIKNGRRASAYPSFIEPILNRTNLKIYRYARATMIKLNKYRRAYGVVYKRHGVEHFVRARKEIIVSAGSIDSPKLLMLSGIGPRKHLESLNIKCILDLPVGQNLMDHVMVAVPFTLQSEGTSFLPSRDITLDMVRNYFTNHDGFLANTLSRAVAYVHSTLSKSKGNSTAVSPDIQLQFLPVATNIPHMLEKDANFVSNVYQKFLKGYEEKDGLTVTVMLGKYYSRGEVRLSSRNPLDHPIIDPKYFSHPDDMKILVEGISFAVKLVEETKVFKKYGARLIDKHFPGCEAHAMRSAKYYECLARQITLTVYHPCGTCSMGKGPSDPKAVVDPSLRVLKTTGLRVVDASIIPEIQNANLNAAVFMIADKAAELILDSWKS